MRIKLLGFVGILAMIAAPAFAGSGTGYSHTSEQGVHIYKGQHGAAYSAQAVQIMQMREKRQAQARKASAVQQLSAQLAAQSRQIDDLGTALEKLQRAQKPAKTRRRVYYGNPRFFGSNGFIGNSHFGGATVQLPRRPHRPRPVK